MIKNDNVNFETSEVVCPNCGEMITVEDLNDTKEECIEIDCSCCYYPIKINKEYDNGNKIIDIDIY